MASRDMGLLYNYAANKNPYGAAANMIDIGVTYRKITIKNKSSILRWIKIHGTRPNRVTGLIINHNNGGYIIQKNSQILIEFNADHSTLIRLEDVYSGLTFDIYAGSCGKAHRDMSIDLHDKHILHHGSYSSHQFIRNNRRCK